ncbi:MAG: hypothetical protein ACF8TS_04180 [Maioricimonas sp. JB049]
MTATEASTRIDCALKVCRRLQQMVESIDFEDAGDREARDDARSYLEQARICLQDIVDHRG